MFRIINFLAVLSLLSLTITPVSAVHADSSISVQPAFVDFGTAKKGQIVTARFTVLNSGDETRTIQFMDFSRPGLKAQIAPRIAAGDSAELNVSWDTSGFDGDVDADVVLLFDGSNNAEVSVNIRGFVASSKEP